jgi:iron-sulfur cluster insertion protein
MEKQGYSTMTDERVKLTDAAKQKLQFMLFDDGKSVDYNNQIRLFVVGGGCAGLNYGFDFSLEEDDDYKIPLNNMNDAFLVVDPMSFPYIEGATIDYTKTLMGESFTFNNPNASATCGCGSSFAA